MPIFEYVCGCCASAFELIVQGDQEPTCPECESADLEKKLSGFAVGAGSTAPITMGSACGSCGDPRGPRACGLD